jgi:heme-degrading monooxygenase HmoA
MLIERSELLVKEGSEDGFAAAMAEKGLKLLAGLGGVKSVSFGRGVENPDKFMLLIEWETMDAHAAYKKDPRNAEFRSLISPFVKGGSMEHFNMS